MVKRQHSTTETASDAPAPTLIGRGGIARLLLAGASFVVIVAGMKAAASILVPFLLAVFIAIVTAPLVLWLNKRIGLPYVVALIAVVLLLIVAGLLAVTVVGQSLAQFLARVPVYQQQLQQQLEVIDQRVRDWGIENADDSVRATLDPQLVMSYLASVASMARDLLGNTLLILLVAVFILLELTTLPDRIRSLPGTREQAWAQVHLAIEKIRQYMAVKTLTSAATGSLIAASLALLGVNQAITLGLLAFMLNFVPNIGSYIAAIPALLLAFIEFGLMKTVYVAIVYLVINNVIGSFIEPKIMGRSLGLSATVIIVSLIFWGWVLGPVGMLLSVPLTIVVRLILEVSDDTRWLAILMSGGTALPDDEASAGPGAAGVADNQ